MLVVVLVLENPEGFAPHVIFAVSGALILAHEAETPGHRVGKAGMSLDRHRLARVGRDLNPGGAQRQNQALQATRANRDSGT